MQHSLGYRWSRDTSGSVLMLTALGILFLIGIGGAGYDLGRQQLVRQKLQQASDAAALAGASMAPGTTDQARLNTAQAFFRLNFPATYLGIARPTVSPTVVARTISVSTSLPVPTSFVSNFGISTMTARAASTVNIRSEFSKLDVVLTIDNSGSMRIMDVGASNTLNADFNSVRWQCHWFFGGTNWTYCNDVNSYNFTTAPTNSGLFGASRLNAVRSAAEYATRKLINPNPSDNRVGLVLWDDKIRVEQWLTNNYGTMRWYLDGMFPFGDTNSTLGLNRAKDIVQFGGRSNSVKVIILLTDGVNNPNPASTNSSSLAACNAAKALPNTLIYTIAFGNDVNTNAQARQFLSDCASGLHGAGQPNLGTYFFVAPDAATLQQAFDTIIGSLQNVRIIQ